MLYIIKKDYFLADYILSAIAGNSDIEIIDYQRIKCHGAKKIPFLIKRFVRAFVYNRKGLWTSMFFKETFLSRVQRIAPADHVLFWGCENLKELLILNNEICCEKKDVFLWNPISTINRNAYSKWEYRHWLYRSGMTVSTFDEGDGRKYGFNIVKQVYRKPDAKTETAGDKDEFDIFFVGVDKRRSATLEKLREAFDAQGLSYNINIITDKHTDRSDLLAGCYTDRPLPYEECLDLISKSRCVLEVLQSGQGGMTLRTLEALFFKKKLITNNTGILHSPIYSPNNIYIIGSGDKRSFREFVESPMDRIPDDTVCQYDISHWIRQFSY